jgi:hypothetical protein
MGSRKAKQNKKTYVFFTVFSAIDQITPLTGQAGLCTSVLTYEDIIAPEAVTITELGTSGQYQENYMS